MNKYRAEIGENLTVGSGGGGSGRSVGGVGGSNHEEDEERGIDDHGKQPFTDTLSFTHKPCFYHYHLVANKEGPHDSFFKGITRVWTPISLQAQWGSRDITVGAMIDKIAVVLLMPSGVYIEENVAAELSDTGEELQLQIIWPTMVSDVQAMHRFMERSPDSEHPKTLALHSMFAETRKHESDSLFSKAVISLPFAVETYFEIEKAGSDHTSEKLLSIEFTSKKKRNHSSAKKRGGLKLGLKER